MFVYQLDSEVLRDEGLALSVEVLEDSINELFSPHLKTHSHLVLEIYLHVVAQITADVDLDLKWGLNVGKHARPAISLMAYLCPNVASLGAIVHMLAFLAKLEDLVVFSAIQALRKDISPIPIHYYLMILQISRSMLSIMIKHDLQVTIKGTISFVQLKLISLDTSLNQCLRFDFGMIIIQSMKQGKIIPLYPEAGKRRFECL